MSDRTDATVTAAEVSELLRLLAEAPSRLNAFGREGSDEQLQRQPSAGAWSAHEILAHLRACADVWGAGIQAMIERDHPTLRYVSPRTRIRKTTYPSEPFSVGLAAFSAQRAELVRTLRALDQAIWERGATFTGTVRGREQTILTYARRIVGHEREHLCQLEQAVQQL